jgi:hypothetical protein
MECGEVGLKNKVWRMGFKNGVWRGGIKEWSVEGYD